MSSMTKDEMLVSLFDEVKRLQTQETELRALLRVVEDGKKARENGHLLHGHFYDAVRVLLEADEKSDDEHMTLGTEGYPEGPARFDESQLPEDLRNVPLKPPAKQFCDEDPGCVLAYRHNGPHRGTVSATPVAKCELCKGSGGLTSPEFIRYTCWKCNGTGEVPKARCTCVVGSHGTRVFEAACPIHGR